MANENTVLQLDNTIPVPTSNGQVNGSVRIVTAAGASAIPNAALPTTAGDYTLRVAGTAPNNTYSWVLEGT